MLEAVAAGDEVAFRRIIAAYHEDMRRVCLVICGDHAIADEATQAAWFIAWKKIETVCDQDRLRPWLVSVAANETKKLMSKRRRRAEFETSFDTATEQGGVDPATGVAEIDLDAAMARLDPDDPCPRSPVSSSSWFCSSSSERDCWRRRAGSPRP